MKRERKTGERRIGRSAWLLPALLFLAAVSSRAESRAPATLDPGELQELRTQPAAIQTLLTDALALTTKNLSYKYGSDDPRNGGMDCSGTVDYLLQKEGVPDVPRQASDIYAWVRRNGLFQAVVSTNPATFELDALKPGDLMFWTGTYEVDRDPPVTHVMIYLGTVAGKTKGGLPRRVMFGASEGRYYDGAPRYGVSVFDFELPGSPPPAAYKNGTARFIGYAPIPHFARPTPVPPPLPVTAASTPVPAPSPAAPSGGNADPSPPASSTPAPAQPMGDPQPSPPPVPPAPTPSPGLPPPPLPSSPESSG